MARPYAFALDLDSSGKTPLFQQIASAVVGDVRRGRLRPGDRLPGSRALAEQLGVHRNTALAAYADLVAQGWCRAQPAGGTFVAEELPEVRARRPAKVAFVRRASRPGFDLPDEVDELELPAPVAPGAIVLAGGVPDLGLVPTAAIARAYRRSLGAARGLLGYAGPQGHPALRGEIARLVSDARGVAATADDVLVTRGSQMAIDLVARTLLRPGDAVAVEVPGYRLAWSALRRAGARLVPVPVDAHGLDVAQLAARVRKDRIRLVYVTPQHQYPTTTTLSAARRLALLDLARRERFAVLEDDYDFEFHYEGRPVLPLASADGAGVVIYVGTLSKILAPGLRLGFVVTSPPLLERLARARNSIDRQGDLVLEAAIAELLELGEVQRHARRMRRVYRTRRDLLVDALRARLGSALSFDVPAGGMALWAKTAPDLDAGAWCRRARERGVWFLAGSSFSVDGAPLPYVRFGFASASEKMLTEAVKRLAGAV